MLRVTLRLLLCVVLFLVGMVATTGGLAMTREESTVDVLMGFTMAACAILIFLNLSFQLGALWTDFRNLYKPKQPQ